MAAQSQRAHAHFNKVLAYSASASALLFAASGALAQEADNMVLASNEDIVVTGSRRASTVQDAPINIAAVSAEKIEALGLSNLTDASRSVPGIYVLDQGARGSARVIVRGLNADGLSSAEGIENDGGGTVATYVGEIPLFVNLKLNDMERVEYLFGPQGTLYGAGTLGGAIRYIPAKPKFGAASAALRSDFYLNQEGHGVNSEFGITVNQPLSDTFAIRASVDRVDDNGFIDYDYVVRQPGVSNPDPDFSNPADVAANINPVRDANTEETWSGRVAARWAPNDIFDATLTYYYQDQDVGARQISSRRSIVSTGKYVSNQRVLEPSENTNDLLSLETTADLGFADLTVAGGYSHYKENGSRDQTDLLIGLEYSYEAFPSFTAYTREDEKDTTTTFEPRLVSKLDGPIQFIAGAFYNRFNGWNQSLEFTPGYPQYIGVNRPDNLEYVEVSYKDLIEKALYGEVSYNLTKAWQVTGGLRYYEYKLKTRDAVDFPLTTGDPTAIFLNFEEGGQKDDGFLFKFNTSYKFSDDKLAYFTVSQGYRIGNSNGVGPCPDPLPPGQIACGLPNEMQYTPDKTINYEIGAHTQWFDRRLTLNGALYYVEWKDPQLASATLNGLIPIRKNGAGAETKGVELSFDADITEQFSISGSAAYTDAELTKLTPNIVAHYNPPGFQNTVTYDDGLPGDRLPGSPKYTASLLFEYKIPVLDDKQLVLDYGMFAAGDVKATLGGRGGGITLPSYTLHNISARLQADTWSITGYVDNLFDKFVETGVRGSPLYNQGVTDDAGDTVYNRSFFTYVLPPRVIGVRLTKDFGG